MVYRTSKYKKLKSEVEKQSKKCMLLKCFISIYQIINNLLCSCCSFILLLMTFLLLKSEE